MQSSIMIDYYLFGSRKTLYFKYIKVSKLGKCIWCEIETKIFKCIDSPIFNQE